MNDGTFLAYWPILDRTIPAHRLKAEALADLPNVAARAGVRVDEEAIPRWSIAEAAKVPGTGNCSEEVLICQIPARRLKRGYRTPRLQGETV